MNGDVKFGSASPLGLVAFGLSTVILNIHNTGVLPLNSVMVCTAIFFGGLAQVIAGIIEFSRNNSFGGTAFVAYGCFWFALAGIWVFPSLSIAPPADPVSLGVFLLLWGIFTLYMFIASLKHRKALQVVFGTLTILFILLAIANFTGNYAVELIAGIEGMFCGGSAIYLSMVETIEDAFKSKA